MLWRFRGEQTLLLMLKQNCRTEVRPKLLLRSSKCGIYVKMLEQRYNGFPMLGRTLVHLNLTPTPKALRAASHYTRFQLLALPPQAALSAVLYSSSLAICLHKLLRRRLRQTFPIQPLGELDSLDIHKLRDHLRKPQRDGQQNDLRQQQTWF